MVDGFGEGGDSRLAGLEGCRREERLGRTDGVAVVGFGGFVL